MRVTHSSNYNNGNNSQRAWHDESSRDIQLALRDKQIRSITRARERQTLTLH
jgi:hypothetical protein